ncbi:MAG: STAS domain-containing protein [Tepidisphaeraceae bacterium]
MKLSLVSIERAGYVKLATDGDITGNDLLEAQGRNPFEMVLGASWATNNILLNLAKTAFMDSSAIGWLIGSQRKAQSVGGKLALHSAQPRVAELFDLLKVRIALNLKDGEESAQQFITTGQDPAQEPRAQNSIG